MTGGNMSIVLNVSGLSEKSQVPKVTKNKNLNKNSVKTDKKLKTSNEDSSNKNNKRVKQKSLAAIVAQNKNRAVKLAAHNVESSKKLTGILKNSKDKDKDKESKDSELVSFVKPSTTGLKTILAKPKVDNKSSKSLADIYNKKYDDKSNFNLLINSTVTDNSQEEKNQSFEVKRFDKNSDKNNYGDRKNFNDKSKFKNNNGQEKKPDRERVYNNKPSGKISSLFGNNPEIPKIGQRLVKPVNEPVFSKVTFTELGLHPYAVSNLEQNMKIVHATTVQQKAIPKIFTGNDILIRSQTGSGKTLTYALPIVESLHKIRPKLSRNDGLKALVVVPTRELALQTYECFLKLIKPYTWIVPGYLVGGEKRKAEKARLRRGCTILVATPGRLLDHIKHTEALKMNDVKCLVLDEADRMLDMGYEKDISEIVSALNVSQPDDNTGYDPMKMLRQNTVKKFDDEIEQDNEPVVEDNNQGKEEEEEEEKEDEETQEYHSATDSDNDTEESPIKQKKVKKISDKNKSDKSDSGENKSPSVKNGRQTILLSATLTSAVEKLAGLTMTNPMFIDAAEDNLKNSSGNMSDINEDLIVPQSVTQSYVVIPPKLKMVTLSAAIVGLCKRAGQHKILVFMATQDMVDYYTNILSSVLTKLDDEDDEDSDPLVDVEFYKLHGNMTQKERTEVFKTFRQSRTGVLLSTDVAARGLDLPKVDSVIQYTGPLSARDYVHRIGRTARAGTAGTAIIFLTPPEIEFVRMLESRKIRIKQEDMDDILLRLMGPLSRQNTVQEAATNLQNKFENFVLNDSKLHAAACKAYASWMRFYTSYPRDMRDIFDRKTLHLGHYAKSFALRDPPQRIGSVNKQLREKNPEKPVHNNRLSNERTERIKQQKESKEHGLGAGALKRSRMLNISEYGDGLAPLKKSKK